MEQKTASSQAGLSLFKLLSVFTFVALIAACQGTSNPAEKLAAKANSPNSGSCTNGGGGCDPSGGDLLSSTSQEVEEAFNGVLKELQSGLLGTMAQNLNSVGETSRLEQYYDKLAGAGSYKLIKEFLKINTDAKSDVDVAVSNNRIEFKLSQDFCQSKEGDKDGSALGTIADGKICISAKGFLTKPQKDLHQEMLAIVIHEISHLVGFDEAKAIAIQKIVSEHPGVYQANFNDTKYNRNNQCGNANEIKEIENSKYWQMRLTEIQNYLGTQIICGNGGMHLGAYQVYKNLNFAVEANGQSPEIHFTIDAKSSGTTQKGDFTPEALMSKYTSDFQSDLAWSFAAKEIGIKVTRLAITFNIEEGGGKGLYVFNGLIKSPTECSHKQLIAQVRAAIQVLSPLGCEQDHKIFSDKTNIKKVNDLANEIMKAQTAN